jgi:hypothetical protein
MQHHSSVDHHANIFAATRTTLSTNQPSTSASLFLQMREYRQAPSFVRIRRRSHFKRSEVDHEGMQHMQRPVVSPEQQMTSFPSEFS